jgi:hypothetical protein
MARKVPSVGKRSEGVPWFRSFLSTHPRAGSLSRETGRPAALLEDVPGVLGDTRHRGLADDDLSAGDVGLTRVGHFRASSDWGMWMLSFGSAEETVFGRGCPKNDSRCP